jgi:two-component system phosphate regulon sensor histidine kinase PhoR
MSGMMRSMLARHAALLALALAAAAAVGGLVALTVESPAAALSALLGGAVVAGASLLGLTLHVRRLRSLAEAADAEPAEFPPPSAEPAEAEADLDSVEVRRIDDAVTVLRRELDELRARSREQLTILQSMHVGVIAINNAHELITLNREAAELLAVDTPPASKAPTDSWLTDPGVRAFIDDALAHPGELADEFEITVGGQRRFLRATASRLRDARGAPTGVLVVLTDITQMRRLEAVRTDFAANASHELRTPITNIKGYVETMLDDPVDDPEQTRSFLSIVARNADRLGRIIDDMMALTTLERDDVKSRFVTQPTPVRPLIEAVAGQLLGDASARGIRIETDAPTDLHGDLNERLAEQAISNLVSNALKYCPPDSVVRIEVAPALMEDGRDAIEVAVVDNGPGIPPEHVPRLFERFYRVDKARSRDMGGTGLGLAIVKHIARVHGGSVEAESELGVGSTFRLLLPAVPAPAVDPNAGPAALFAAGGR